MNYKHALDDILTEEQMGRLNSFMNTATPGDGQLDYNKDRPQFDEKNDAHRVALDIRHTIDDFEKAMVDAVDNDDLRKLQYLKSVLYKAYETYGNYGKKGLTDIMKDVGPLSDY